MKSFWINAHICVSFWHLCLSSRHVLLVIQVSLATKNCNIMFENHTEWFFSDVAEKKYIHDANLKFKKLKASLCLPPLCIIKVGKSVKANVISAFTRTALLVCWAILFLFHIQSCVDDWLRAVFNASIWKSAAITQNHLLGGYRRHKISMCRSFKYRSHFILRIEGAFSYSVICENNLQ